jgi:23S rRNA (guanosine2251-2'-O)-methyltransferase
MYQKLSNTQLNRLLPNEAISKNKLDLYVVLDNVRSLNNVGSVFRTSDAFGVKKIFLCGITGTPPDREIHKTALGAELSVEWEYQKSATELVSDLKKSDIKIFAVEQTTNSKMLQNIFNIQTTNIALVFGNEVNGVDQNIIDICDGVIEIPQLGSKHSLNVSVSVGVVLWEFLRNKM